MASSDRRRMQSAVNVYRDAEAGLAQRRPKDLLMLTAAADIVQVSEDLSTDLVVVHARDAASLSDSLRLVIGEAVRRGIRADAAGLERIGDPVSRLICQRQAPIAEQLHLMAAVLMGVEAGLRDVVAGHAARIVATEDAARSKRPPQDKRLRPAKSEILPSPTPAAATLARNVKAPAIQALSDTTATSTDAVEALAFGISEGGAGPSSPVRPDSPDL